MTGNIPIFFPMTAARNEETEKLRLIIQKVYTQERALKIIKTDDKTKITTFFRALAERLKKDLGATTKNSTKKKYFFQSLPALFKKGIFLIHI